MPHPPLRLVLTLILALAGVVHLANPALFLIKFSAILLTNDILWWLPFALILWHAWRSRSTPAL